MSDRIDEELAKISAQGKKPKVIYVGSRLYLDLHAEQNEIFAADLVGMQRVEPHPDHEVKEYKGIPVVFLDTADLDYLSIET